MVPLEPWKKILVDKKFFETEHGQMACNDCHGGNPDSTNKKQAHEDVIADPTFNEAESVCGECHDEIAGHSVNSLHFTLDTFNRIIRKRAAKDTKILHKIDVGMKNHCTKCHSSCGQCHVSRPDVVEGGFVSGHLFQKRPHMTEQCTACHGSRKGNEYLGKIGQPDVHYFKKQMDCVACHEDSLHNDGKTKVDDIHEVETLPNCEKCHFEIEKHESHTIHRGRVQCQVCHAQKYTNCFACHVGKDKNGLSYYKNSEKKEMIKIGFNPRQTENRPYKWTLLRRVPIDPGLFDFYIKNALTRFDALPTWKYTSPHNIRRRTHQNRSCDNCHGNAELFLLEKDVKFIEANRDVIVPENMIPEKIGKSKKTKRKNRYF